MEKRFRVKHWYGSTEADFSDPEEKGFSTIDDAVRFRDGLLSAARAAGKRVTTQLFDKEEIGFELKHSVIAPPFASAEAGSS